MMKKWMTSILAVVLSVTAAACSNGNEQAQENQSPTAATAGVSLAIDQPVELIVYQNANGGTEETFMGDYGDYIKKKYPNVSFKFYTRGTNSQLRDLITAGVNLDLIITSSGVLSDIPTDGLGKDISDLVKKYNVDLTPLEPSAVNMMRQAGKGELYGLPVKNPVSLIAYNRDLFQRFGVPYPKDGMTWDEMFSLSRQMTRIDDGVHYVGLLMSFAHISSMNQLSQEFIDPKTGKAAFHNDNWKLIFDNLSRFYLFPGAETLQLSGSNLFYKEHKAAMFAAALGSAAAFGTMNWDVVSLPYYKERPGVGSGPYPIFITVASTSKHRDEAFKSLVHLASKEVQQVYFEQGTAPALKKSEFKGEFGKNNPDLNGKNVQSIIPNQFANPITLSKDQAAVALVLNSAFNEVIGGKKDSWTALREAEEKANAIIEAAK